MSDKIEVSNWCRESWPCQHGVTINGVDKGTMNGAKIYKLYKEKGQKVPEHFKRYSGFNK
jgi:hypothetical protein